ncbi:glycosyltransferase family 4 protein [Halococcus sp. IIIV-5B]|uniref:glycosyltransferase family 4 protein n=1 Tax=Halococcus sp. IIIV-5B TaxID=2321230 RepID=UPI000E74CA78|nr:glycosyltransferase family 4 protein [Halococcus sp. IIIV-5B]RJT07140.1 glycosyltransferase family 1 protein [Halococcus sp. IIIV-5B]
MDVGLVIYGDLATNTGGFRYDRKLIETLRDHGDRVDVISLPWREPIHGLLDGFSDRLLDRLDTDFDVLLEDELASPTLVGLNRRLRARRNVSIVTIVHHLRCSEENPRWRNRFYRAFERRYLDGVDGAICNSEKTRRTVTELASLPTTVVPPAGDRFDPAIDAMEIEARATDPGPLRICFLGSLVPRKGLDTLIEGLSRIPDGRWELCVVGHKTDLAYVAAVCRRVEAFDLDGVSFVGELTDDELAPVLERHHVLAIPSTHEGFGIAYLEGMSFGLPALATAAGGARAFVDHGENGFLLRPDDPGSVARAIRTLDADRARLARMGTAARERYEGWPTWAESTDEGRRFLEAIAGTTAESRGSPRVEA